MEAPARTHYHNTLGYPLLLSPNVPHMAFLPIDVLRIILGYCDRTAVEVLFATSRRLRFVASAVPRLKDSMCGIAAFEGHQAVIVWARSNKAPWEKKQIGADWNPYNTCEMALLGKHPELFHWAREKQAPFTKTSYMTTAASLGNLTLLQKLWETQTKDGTGLLDRGIALAAATNGHVEVIKWFLSQSSCLNQFEISQTAAQAGQLDVLKWFYVEAKALWAPDMVKHASQSSNVLMLEWLSTLPECTFNSECLEIAAEHGNIVGMQFFRSMDIPWTEAVCLNAARCNRTTALEWLRKNGAPFENNALIDKACKSYAFETLTSLLANGLTWPAGVGIETFKTLHSGVLEWLHLNKPELLNPGIEFRKAMERGDIGALDFLRSISTPWPEDCCQQASDNEALEWALKNNAPRPANLDLHYARVGRFYLLSSLTRSGISVDREAILKDPQVDQDQARKFFQQHDEEARNY